MLNLHWLQYKTWELLLPYGCCLSSQHVLDWNLPISIFSVCLYSVDQIAVALTHTDTLLRILSESEILQKWRLMSFFQILRENSRYQWWLELLMLIFEHTARAREIQIRFLRWKYSNPSSYSPRKYSTPPQTQEGISAFLLKAVGLEKNYSKLFSLTAYCLGQSPGEGDSWIPCSIIFFFFWNNTYIKFLTSVGQELKNSIFFPSGWA